MSNNKDTPPELTLVRIWKDYKSDSINVFVKWNNGRFSLPGEHPVSRELWDSACRQVYRLTVYSTDELEWVIDGIQSVSEPNLYHFTCIPRLRQLRNSIAPDVYLVHDWLAAEKEWRLANPVEELAEALAHELRVVQGTDCYRKIANALIESGWRKGDES